MDKLYRYWGLAIYTVVLLLILFLPAHAADNWVLSFTICNQSKCQEQMVQPPEGASMMDCVKQGQMVAQQWLANNKPPGWVVRKYRCGPRGTSV